MKKAKEHYEIFVKEREVVDLKIATANLMSRFMGEVNELSKIRGTSPGSIISILIELNKKWNALIRFDAGFKRDGFLNLLRHKFPDLELALTFYKIIKKGGDK